ncbi:unnamed protein product, partial [marine sediment metagenome]
CFINKNFVLEQYLAGFYSNQEAMIRVTKEKY